MNFYTRIANKRDQIVEIDTPVSEDKVDLRQEDYEKMSRKAFNKKHRLFLTREQFTPVELKYKGKTYSLQLNHCNNPFCRWFGENQSKISRLSTRGRKRYKYRIDGDWEKEDRGRMIICNNDPNVPGAYGNCATRPVSNWSAAEEIKRLVTINTPVDIEPEYNYHKDSCNKPHTNPFDNPEEFQKYGKSKYDSQRLRCKECYKITTLVPEREKAFTYHQQRSEIVPTLASMLINRVPVKRACEILNISSQTYYDKLEYVYLRCLEFLSKFETNPLSDKFFDKLWINTDMFIYYLNNSRHKLKGNKRRNRVTKESFKRMETNLIVSGDIHSGYVLRADLAYDWDATREKLLADTKKYKCDHMEESERKNARLEHSYFPQPPTKFDKENLSNIDEEIEKYKQEKKNFDTRFDYVNGLHVSPRYTAIAHFWLLKNLLNVKDWFFINDDDGSLKNSIFRVFKDEIKNGYANYFLCQVDHDKQLSQALKEHQKSKIELKNWRDECGLSKKLSIWQIAQDYLEHQLEHHNFFEEFLDDDGNSRIVRAGNPVEHPLASPDAGYRTIDVLTDLSGLNNKQLAKLLMQVNSRVTDNFIQELRRRVSMLERPLLTARAHRKSYIYSNYNPKYAQYLATILRTYYNFCDAKKDRKGNLTTPAMRIGIADKVFDWNDILYFK